MDFHHHENIVYLFLCRFLLLSISRKLAGLLLLGAFAWKWEVPISLVISVRLSVLSYVSARLLLDGYP